MSIYCGASFGGGQGYTDTCGQEEYGKGTPLAQCKQCMRQEIYQLKTDNESLRKDAERYRWIKGNASVMLKKTAYFTSGTSYIGTVYPKESDLDTAIDVSMANDSPENPS